MSGDAATTFESPASETPADLSFASAALVAAAVPFVAGGLLVAVVDLPPSSVPTLGMLSHTLWALAVAILAFGVAALLRRAPALRRGLAGYLAAGTLALGVLQGLQWATWAYVDVRASREAEYELILDAVITPFGAGHLLAYCILVGGGLALLGRALRRTALTGRYVALAGVSLGTLTAGTALVSLVAAFGGGSEGHPLFDVATLLLPVLYLWAAVLGVDVYRRGPWERGRGEGSSG